MKLAKDLDLDIQILKHRVAISVQIDEFNELKEKINGFAPLNRIEEIEKNLKNFTTSEEMREFIKQMDKKLDNIETKSNLKAT